MASSLGSPDPVTDILYNKYLGLTTARLQSATQFQTQFGSAAPYVLNQNLMIQPVPDVLPSDFTGVTGNAYSNSSVTFPHIYKFTRLPLISRSPLIKGVSYVAEGTDITIFDGQAVAASVAATNVLRHAISKYGYRLYVNDFYTPSTTECPWTFDVDSGVLTFMNINGVPQNRSADKIEMSFYSYQGAFGANLHGVVTNSNVTSRQVSFLGGLNTSNVFIADTAPDVLKVTGNVNTSGYLFGDGSFLKNVTLNQVANSGNVTSNIVQFSNGLTVGSFQLLQYSPYSFTTAGTYQVTFSTPVIADIVVIGGGGAGSRAASTKAPDGGSSNLTGLTSGIFLSAEQGYGAFQTSGGGPGNDYNSFDSFGFGVFFSGGSGGNASSTTSGGGGGGGGSGLSGGSNGALGGSSGNAPGGSGGSTYGGAGGQGSLGGAGGATGGLVAGGGGGGRLGGGGGGGGASVYIRQAMLPADTYIINVGSGGLGTTPTGASGANGAVYINVYPKQISVGQKLTLAETASNVLTVTGNVSATSYFGDGSNLTGILATTTSNLQQVTDVGAITTTRVRLNGGVSVNNFTMMNNQTGSVSITTNPSGVASQNSVAMGNGAGNSSQGSGCVAIGREAGESSQGVNSDVLYGANSIATGTQAGRYSQNAFAVAMGWLAGNQAQGSSAVAIGSEAGRNRQGSSAIAIGVQAGYADQNAHCIAIGSFAGFVNQPENSIILNATGAILSPATASAFYVTPVRNVTTIPPYALGYNATTKEVVSFTSNLHNVLSYGNVTSNNVQFLGGLTAGSKFVVNPSETSNVLRVTGNVSATSFFGDDLTVTGSVSATRYLGSGSDLTGVLKTVPTLQQVTTASATTTTRVVLNGNVTINGMELDATPGKSDIALGYSAGSGALYSVAIGESCGVTAQQGYAIAVGKSAGRDTQKEFAIAIGSGAGDSNQGTNSIAIGQGAGTSFQGNNSIAIGQGAGNSGQPNNSIILSASGSNFNPSSESAFYVKPIRNVSTAPASALGYNTSTSEVVSYTSNLHNVLSYGNVTSNNVQFLGGLTAGSNFVVSNTALNVVTVTGNVSATRYLGSGSDLTGVLKTVPTLQQVTTTSATTTTRVVLNGNVTINGMELDATPGKSDVALGYSAGSGASFSVSIGNLAGGTNQQTNSVAIGSGAGMTNQQSYCVAIGENAGGGTQTSNAIAIGNGAGQTSQGNRAIAIGSSAGQTSQGVNADANGANSIAIGNKTGQTGQNAYAVALGYESGRSGQGVNSVAIGNQSGQTAQVSGSVAIGFQAGQSGQGSSSIAIGYQAGQSNQPANSTILNASGSGLNPSTASAFYVKPIRSVTTAPESALGYNTSTSEVVSFSGSLSNIHTVLTTGNVTTNVPRFNAGLAVNQYFIRNNQTGSISINTNQNGASSQHCVAIGSSAGNLNQNQFSIALGTFSGSENQDAYSIAIGHNAGYQNQGSNCIAIGSGAASYNQPDNSIFLNASGSIISPTTASAFYVNPVRSVAYSGTMLGYNPGTNEIYQYGSLDGLYTTTVSKTAPFSGIYTLACIGGGGGGGASYSASFEGTNGGTSTISVNGVIVCTAGGGGGGGLGQGAGGVGSGQFKYNGGIGGHGSGSLISGTGGGSGGGTGVGGAGVNSTVRWGAGGNGVYPFSESAPGAGGVGSGYYSFNGNNYAGSGTNYGGGGGGAEGSDGGGGGAFVYCIMYIASGTAIVLTVGQGGTPAYQFPSYGGAGAPGACGITSFTFLQKS